MLIEFGECNYTNSFLLHDIKWIYIYLLEYVLQAAVR